MASIPSLVVTPGLNASSLDIEEEEEAVKGGPGTTVLVTLDMESELREADHR